MNMSDPIIGQKLGDYTIQELLGKGGMARVYKGYDEALDRYAAVKVITSDFVATADELEYQERFQREARSIARLRHPNIVGVYQFGHLDMLYYMAMVFLDGDDLRVALRKYADLGQRMAHDDVLKMAREVASALDYAHTQGVIHRDIKPSNIMLTTTGATLTDFGLALNTMEGTAGDTFGSAHYIAPEQAISSARAVPQSDLYSLGVVLYEAFTGRVPFDDPSVMSVALKHLNEPPPRPTATLPDFPKSLENVLMKVLSKEPRDRYPNGEAFVAALEEALDLEGDTARVERSAPRPAVIVTDDGETTLTSASPAVPPQLAVRGEGKNDDRERGRLPLIIGIVLLALLLLGGAFVLLSAGGDDGEGDDDDTDTVVQVVETEVPTESATEIATEASTEDVGNTATELPTEAVAEQTTEVAVDVLTVTATQTDTSTPTPTFTDTVQPTATPTQTAQPTNTPVPTNTPTLTHTTTPTLQPTDTSTPTAEASPTSMQTPTESPTVGPTEAVIPIVEDPDFELRYTEGSIILENVSNRRINISSMALVGDNGGFFRVTAWQDSLSTVNGSLSSFASGGCVQLVTTISERLSTNCRFYNVWIRDDRESVYFWSPDNTTFEVRLNNEVIGLCLVAAGNCEFDLSPLAQTEESSDAAADSTTTTDETDTENAELILRYNDNSFLLFVLSSTPQDLSGVSFAGDAVGTFAAISWQNNLSNAGRRLDRLDAGGCLQVVTRTDAVQEADCDLYNVWLLRANQTAHFWFDAGDNMTFDVLNNDIVVTSCLVATSSVERTCIINLP